MWLKPSRYNIPVGDHGLFNTATGNYVVLDGALAATWGRLRDGAMVEPGEAGLLFRAGFAVEDHLDELAAVEIAFSAGRTAKATPHLTIAPTLDCNYACDYCFEEHVRGSMAPEMQMATVELVRSAFADGPGELSVTWFGGEPLMALSVVKGLSRRFLDLVAEGVLASYHADLVTNGQLLRPGVAAELMALGIRQVQVTLDGPREVHDRRRTLKGGGATFATIAENLCGLPGDLATVVRVNVDRENAPSVPRLFSELKDLGLAARVTVDVALVEDFTGRQTPVESMLTPLEFAALEAAWLNDAARHGVRLHTARPAPRLTGVCQVDSPRSVVIAPTGELYRCWAELGNGGTVVGHLLDRGSWNALAPTALSVRDPFDDEECRACVLLPSCMGGCPLLRQSHRYWGRKVCPPLKHNVHEVLAAHFRTETRIVRWVREETGTPLVADPPDEERDEERDEDEDLASPVAARPSYVPSSVRVAGRGRRSPRLRIISSAT
ncbi:MAG TPA: radical SAM protein [Kofleriaceae bacterium]